jgi:hypothetical protein
MRKLYIYLLISVGVYAQTPYEPDGKEYLDINNLKISLSSIGEFGFPSEENQMPNGSEKNCLFAQSLWLGAKDENNNLKIAANEFRDPESKTDFRPGPILIAPNLSTDENYDKVYTITKEEIEYHITNFANAGYIMSASIAEWPGSAILPNLTSVSQLAPFRDLNNNGEYEPDLGEYPLIRGDKALYVIYNDKMVHESSGGQPLEIEIRLMFYGYNSSNKYLKNTVFLNYAITNYSLGDFYDFYASLFSDLHIGSYDDEYIGSDSTRNLIFGYNKTNFDGDALSAINTYGLNPPAFGIVSLNNEVNNTSSYEFVNSGVLPRPIVDTDYYNYMQGNLSNGHAFHTWDTNFPVSKFIYNHAIPFTESQLEKLSGDRLYLLNINKDTLVWGQTQCFDYAMIFAHDTTLNNLQQVDYLFEMTDSIQAFYDQKDWDCNEFEDVLSAERYENNNSDVEVINKLNSWQIITKKEISHIQVFDVLGKRVLSNVLKGNNIDHSSLPQGVYFINIQDEEGRITSIKVVR